MKRTIRTCLLLILVSFLFSGSVSRAKRADDFTYHQWGFNAFFFEDTGNERFDMRIPDWNSKDGNMEEEILVAVLDGGIDYNHPDLKDRIYLFSEEEQEALHCSAYGYDAVKGDGSIPPIDIHGTHVAGIIGASWNDFGVSGAGSNVRFVNINVCVGDTTPVEYTLRAYDFIKRALEYGIPIRLINNSWANLDTTLALLPLVEEVGKLGALSFFAAGNDGSDLERGVMYPAQYLHGSPYAVIIGAHDWKGENAYFSNYGESIADVFAPGYDIMSAVTGSANGQYDYRSGTSMATPSACGACAVLAAAHPEIADVTELKTLFLSCTRPSEGLQYVKANGLVDLSVDLRKDFNPVITSVSVSGRQVRITGAHFRTEGTVLLFDANDKSRVLTYDPATVIRTDNQILLTLDEEPHGLIKLRVQEAVYGKYDTDIALCAPSSQVFDTAHALLRDFGQPDVLDAASDCQAAGFLCGAGGDLYYMPLSFLEENGDLAFQLLYRYDPEGDRWDTLSTLPERVAAVQCACTEDSIYVVGMNASGNNACAYQYDVSLDQWMALPAGNIPHRTSVVNCDGTLLLVGGASTAADGSRVADAGVFAYDPESGEVTETATLLQEIYDAQALYRDGFLYVYGSSPGGSRPVQSLQRLELSTGEAIILSDAFPEWESREGIRSRKLAVSLHGGLALCEEGLLLCGPRSTDGRADTYLLRHNAETFVPLARTASDAPLIWQTACVYEERLYVIGRSFVEEDFQVFRSVALADLLP